MSAAGAPDGRTGAVAASRVAVAGLGRMGQGIAVACAARAQPVQLVDLKPRDDAQAARTVTQARHDMLLHLQALHTVMGGLAPEQAIAGVEIVGEPQAAGALGGADIVFEAAPETEPAKRAVFAQLDRFCRADAVLASTTSTMLVTDIAKWVSRPQRIVNAHWLNPAYLMPLVEISPHPEAAPTAVSRLRACLASLGKVVVSCAPAPGYIVPRLQTLLMNEAARMVEEGVASAEDIDRATRYGLGLRYSALGLLEFIDLGGSDITYHASRYLAQTLDAARFAPPALIARMVAEGHTGLKDGQGFFDHRGVDRAAYQRDVLQRVAAAVRAAGLDPSAAPID